MAKKNSRNKENKRRKKYQFDYLSEDGVVIDLQTFASNFSSPSTPSIQHRKIKAKNQAQGQFMAAIKANHLIFGLGPAGTGKSYCAAGMAAEALKNNEVDQVIFTRPAVETGESMGFLPGKLDEKFEPYFSAFKHCLIQNMGKGVVDCAVRNGNLVVEPLAYLRGKTFNRSFVILDEAQNCTVTELKMFLTRIGKDTTVVINGDLKQSDIGASSGLWDAIQRVGDLHGVYVHEFDYDDIVRSQLVKQIIMRYEDSQPLSNTYQEY